MEDTKPLFTENQEFQYRYEALKISSFGISEGQYFIARNKSDNITIEIVFAEKMLFFEILIELKPAVTVDKGG